MRVVKWLLGGILGVSMLGYIAIYGLSERYLSDVPAIEPFAYPIRQTPENIEAGRHLARTRGCFGCHGQQLEGRDFAEQWDWVGRAVAPNIAAVAREKDAPTLEAAIRHGVGFDGRALWSMPSYNYVRLSDSDLANLIAFLRAAPVVSSELPLPELGFRARLSMVFENEEHMAAIAQQVPQLRLNAAHDDPRLVAGEYLAMTTCNECHGLDLRGQAGPGGTPDLAIVAAYTESDFGQLMKKGIGLGGREDLRLMSVVAQDRFASFTSDEIANIYEFLKTLAYAPAASALPSSQ